MMLGYTLEDLNSMTDAVEDAIKSGRLAPDIEAGLETSLSFLQGLWAEGYFD